MSKLWLPGATRHQEPNNGTWTGGPMKGLLHSTEVPFRHGSASYQPGTKPHLEVIGTLARTIQATQFYPFNQPARSLVDAAGGVRTNRDGVIQIELGFQAAHVGAVPDWFWTELAGLLRKVEDLCGINPEHWARFIAYRSNPPSSYGMNNGVRFSPATWERFDGWCGHMHAPENVHGDPGLIPVDKLKKPAPVPAKVYHVIKPGDTVRSVAAANKISVLRLWRLNQRFAVGQKIRVR